ncbi:HPt (histidine-containing phosphotransfer) domain-containing protein [Sphingomonas sp. SORGH_AS 950]|uniref:Hpt domain-containing protein n=1 Tax=Sphingomonas sp. SORGH_AS_0950 TaxID=3041792 RepID=UPI002787CF50|nr:Hpt domain-containing protein [Sphingomonas sp. SORGH_AS_0950]MDQ1156683.1 HPt (histidine-containing phosphotransfer) domain-containing protein [Sphingomonas sp. SORGH_AS_0950]
MTYEHGTIDSALAAVAGDEPAVIQDLRRAFVDGVNHAVETLHAAEGGQEWREAALRLKGLAASVNALPLMTLAAQAATRDAPDAELLVRIGEVVARL